MFSNFQFLFLLFALLAEIIGTIGGYGSSVFFVPIANFYFDFQTVLGITAIFHLSSNISKIALFRKGLDKNLLLYIGLPSVIFVVIGALATKYFSTHYLESALGIFLISISLIFLLNDNLAIKNGPKESIIGGSLSGFIAGLLGTGGAIRGITMAAFNLEKSVFVATSAFIDFGVDFTRTIVYFFNGYIKQEIFIYIPFLLLIGFIGTYIGSYILTNISQKNFKKTSLILILIIGLITLAKVNLS
jgi:uncharacterized membrane protein YfcA